MNTFGKSLLALGAIGLSSLAVAPAFAGGVGGAYASGSSAIVLMNGASQSVGGEIAAPSGAGFAGPAVVVTPTMVGDLSTNTALIGSLSVDPGATAAAPGGTSFTAAAATALGAAGSLDAQVSIIRAGAGVDGLD